ncbi:histidine phosphatase family protein [Luteimonas wenzhouensis]|jgi:broad specificity phosphatase PhoE|uniref:Histidine phosphatase family protein n=2 Tax=Luteimonas wenzhouensis TaxID=2599615 RepID=A0A5C5U5G0_9GAMM|nr:histidine phosphatase family protein [Luteimonas wenzhouensis]
MPHNAGMAPLRPLIPLALSALLAACAGMPATPGDATGATYIVVRHAEKEDAPGPDPALSSEGQARAERLARRLAGEPLVAVYATGYRRTRDTVAPAARRHGLAPRTYDPHQTPAAFAAALRAAHPAGTVLVAGHSNTVPAIVAALCACETGAMDESEFDRLSIVRIDRDGRPTLSVTRQDDAGR